MERQHNRKNNRMAIRDKTFLHASQKQTRGTANRIVPADASRPASTYSQTQKYAHQVSWKLTEAGIGQEASAAVFLERIDATALVYSPYFSYQQTPSLYALIDELSLYPYVQNTIESTALFMITIEKRSEFPMLIQKIHIKGETDD
ncbi:MAG: hypothetical protein LBJ41_09345 [Treponema sp.]|jgi:hypothetical protein|nr:hypothetical protein [Treponema sp.]